MGEESLKALCVVLGAALLMALGGLITRRLLRWVAPWTDLTPPRSVTPEEWQRVVINKESMAPAAIGRLESLLVYLVVLAANHEAAGLVIGGWLAFKVASKWEIWSNVVKVPDAPFEEPSSGLQLDYLRARREWGFRLYDRFLLGTLLNILQGMSMAWLVSRYVLAD